MARKIYRNGTSTRDNTVKVLGVNVGIFLFGAAMAYGVSRFLSGQNYEFERSVYVFVWLFFMLASALLYAYRTITRLQPLAEIEGDILEVKTGIFVKKRVSLDRKPKITFQYASEFDQRMKVKYPKEMAIEFRVPQTDCDIEKLKEFICLDHDIEVRYS